MGRVATDEAREEYEFGPRPAASEVPVRPAQIPSPSSALGAKFRLVVRGWDGGVVCKYFAQPAFASNY